MTDFELPGYELIRHIASGGMADVYEARQSATTRRVAVKIMKPRLLDSSASRARFARETKAMAALSHENVIGVLDAGGNEGERPFITMEYVAGRTLRSGLQESGALPFARACRLGVQVARGLEHAHQAGVVHRDLKPENIMLTVRADHSERVLLVDFGIASILDDRDEASLTAEGSLLGTPHYMSPEQARGERPVSAAADIYALGAVLYEMITGNRAHDGPTRQAVLHHVLYHRAPSLSRAAGVPPEFIALVERCLAKRATQRPGPSDVVRHLESCLAASRFATQDSESNTAEVVASPAGKPTPIWRQAALLLLGVSLGWFLRAAEAGEGAGAAWARPVSTRELDATTAAVIRDAGAHGSTRKHRTRPSKTDAGEERGSEPAPQETSRPEPAKLANQPVVPLRADAPSRNAFSTPSVPRATSAIAAPQPPAAVESSLPGASPMRPREPVPSEPLAAEPPRDAADSNLSRPFLKNPYE